MEADAFHWLLLVLVVLLLAVALFGVGRRVP
jgi:hypothetical protein